MENISKIARASEWWEYKLPPLLAVAYATALFADKSLYELAPRLGVLLLGVIIGAAYVSIVNDLTDLKEDAACGKQNRLSKFSPPLRMLFVLIPVFLGVAFAFIFLNDVLSIVLYSLSWIAFSLYSIPPFRFKKKGVLGVLADASGAHLFTSLFLLSGTFNYFNIEINWVWFAAVGVWALMCGVRGILWHQFYDRDNDLKIGLTTFATKRNPISFQNTSFAILGIELLAHGVMLVYLSQALPVVALLLYGLMLIGYNKKFGLALIAIVPPKNQRWHLLMMNYYQLFWPLSLIITAIVSDPFTSILFLIHLVFFPIITRNTFLDMLAMLKAMVKKLVFNKLTR